MKTQVVVISHPQVINDMKTEYCEKALPRYLSLIRVKEAVSCLEGGRR